MHRSDLRRKGPSELPLARRVILKEGFVNQFRKPGPGLGSVNSGRSAAAFAVVRSGLKIVKHGLKPRQLSIARVYLKRYFSAISCLLRDGRMFPIAHQLQKRSI